MVRRSLGLSFAAGIFISIGGSVYLSSKNNVVGAVLFCVALLSICYLQLFLFTGKVGYIVSSHKGSDVAELLLTLVGNLVGTLVGGMMISQAKPALMSAARINCEARLTLDAAAVLIAAFFCGILMYTAVAIYKEKNSPLGIFFCVPVFILCGFEHSIADMFYFFAARMFSAEVFVFLLLVVIGNALGGMLIPAIRMFTEEKTNG